MKEVERFIGSLESSLDFYERLGEDRELTAEVNRLREKVTLLRSEVSEENVPLGRRLLWTK